MVGILGLIVAIVCVIALIWKNWHMAIVSLAGALIVIAFNAMDPVTTLSEKFMTGIVRICRKLVPAVYAGCYFR